MDSTRISHFPEVINHITACLDILYIFGQFLRNRPDIRLPESSYQPAQTKLSIHIPLETLRESAAVADFASSFVLRVSAAFGACRRSDPHRLDAEFPHDLKECALDISERR